MQTNATKLYWNGQLQMIVMGELSTAHGVAANIVRNSPYKIEDYTYVRCYVKD